MYTFESRVRFSETDEKEELTLGAIMNYLQDCCGFHSQDLGVGGEWQRERDRAWLLNSWQIVICRRPKLYEYIEIGTQPYEFKGSLGMRNFRIRDHNGLVCVVANSVWCLVQPSVMRPVRITEEDTSPYTLEAPLEMDYAKRRIAVPKEGRRREPILVRREHIDSNHHVNNSQYVIMAQHFLPEGFVPCQVRAEYRYQAVPGDVIIPVVTEKEDKIVVQLARENGSPYAIVEFEGNGKE